MVSRDWKDGKEFPFFFSRKKNMSITLNSSETTSVQNKGLITL